VTIVKGGSDVPPTPTPNPATKPTSSTQLRSHADALGKQADGWRKAAARSDQNHPTPQSLELDQAQRDVADLRAQADTERLKQHAAAADYYDDKAAKLEQRIPQLEQAKANDGSPRAVLEAKARDADDAIRQYRDKADSLDEERDATAEAARLRAAGDEAGASSADARAAGAHVVADLLDPQDPVVEPRYLKAATTGILDPPAPPPDQPEPNWPAWDKPPGNWGPRASADDLVPDGTLAAATTISSDSPTGDDAPPPDDDVALGTVDFTTPQAFTTDDLALGDDVVDPSTDPGTPTTADDLALGTVDLTTSPAAATTDGLALSDDVVDPSSDPGAPITADDIELTPLTADVDPVDPVMMADLDTPPEMPEPTDDVAAGMSDPPAPEPLDSYAQADPFGPDDNAGDDPFQDLDADASEPSIT
jgi:hypothetical protein